MRGALQSEARHRTDGFEAECHATAIDGVRFVDEFGQKFGDASGVLQPLGGVVQQIVRRGIGVDLMAGIAIRTASKTCLHDVLLAKLLTCRGATRRARRDVPRINRLAGSTAARDRAPGGVVDEVSGGARLPDPPGIKPRGNCQKGRRIAASPRSSTASAEGADGPVTVGGAAGEIRRASGCRMIGGSHYRLQ